MSELSKILKEAREKNKISLEEFSRLNRISLQYLKYLEIGSFEKLPAPVYVNGILKIYAQTFSLDENVLYDFFLKEIQTKTDNSMINNNSSFNSNFNFSTHWAKSLVIIFLMALVFGYLFYQFSSLNSPPKIFIEPSSDFITSAESLIFTGRVIPSNSKLVINNQSILLSESGEFRKEFFLKSGSNIFIAVVTNKYGKRTEVLRKVLRE